MCDLELFPKSGHKLLLVHTTLCMQLLQLISFMQIHKWYLYSFLESGGTNAFTGISYSYIN